MEKSSILTKRKSKLSGLKILTTVFALIPILALILITLNLVLGSRLVINQAGWSLFSPTLNFNEGQYGLLPAIWGTLLVALVATIIAFPVSLFLAILANDFSVGFMSVFIRWSLGVLSGIPPIIYAFMAPVFFSVFIWPKFAGEGLPEPDLLKMAQYSDLPLDGSTLLGGFLLSLLIIPFMAPLIDDAIKNVPHSLKEASLSLGTNRWHTLKNVTLPIAAAGIGNALILGVLTGVGESVIVGFAIGFQTNNMPAPLFDILEDMAPLTSSIVGLSATGFSRAQSSPVLRSMGSFAGLLLLFSAFVILGVSTYLQSRLKKRPAL